MNPDVYGTYNKQQIESLTTDGDGETKFFLKIKLAYNIDEIQKKKNVILV